jgi:biotin carboxyl carrier protein
VLEAMKMQHEVCSTVDGEVTHVTAAAGTQVAAGDLLIEIRVDGAG